MVRLDLDFKKLADVLRRRTGFDYPQADAAIETLNINFEDMKNIIEGLGEFLSKLHSIKLVGFGPIKEDVFNRTGKLEGRYESWYEFICQFFDEYSRKMDEVLSQEERSGKRKTELSPANRRLMDRILSKRSAVRRLITENRGLLETAPSRFLHGNIHMGSILARSNEFAGLDDFGQILAGDPVDDIAYFSVMPRGQALVKYLTKAWSRGYKDRHFKEKFHLYRLLEAYRKIFSRYIKHHYLEIYPEPLQIAREELGHYNIE